MQMNLDHYSKKHKLILAAVSLLLVYLVIHHLTRSKPPAIPVPRVTVQIPQEREMVEYVTQTGTTVALNSVDLVARVEGYLNEIKFKDGSYVKKGTELFIIEPEIYFEQLKAAQATVAAQKAAYAYSKSEYARQKKMYKDNATSLNNVESWLAKTQESEAEVAKAIANEQIAAINYSYTHVLAPFDGRIGRHLVDAGNLVGNGKATDLANIEQVDTLYVYFNLNEIDLIKLRAAAREQGISEKNLNTVTVGISMQNETSFAHKATLNFINTGLNASTGTMELRALLENKDHLFVPGLFVQVRIPITKPGKHLTVPATALLYDQIGPYLLAVDKNQVVQTKRVVLGSVDQGMQAIISGITIEDRIIISGQQNATPGNKVDPQEAKSSVVVNKPNSK